MAFTPGSKLAEYEDLTPIGAGGMGEVYKARDSKLGREVAIKVLPEIFSQDKERLGRFEREARLLASLNHPSIATIYDLEECDGVHYLVLEFVPGETLAERISQGAIPVDEALPLFVQIAEALEAAHEKGIIHRDLKPANIKITPEGKVKVLDFGLAKAFTAGDELPADSSQSPTLTKGTALGTIMGTAAYMSPEQARGKPVDKRSDIWAFGVVAYEALTGEKAFKGETVTDILSSVIRAELNWETLPTDTPWAVRHLLRRCLEKEPRQRLHDIADARIEIEETMSRPMDQVHVGSQPELAPRSTRRSFLPWGVAAIGIIVGIVAWLSRPIAEIDEASIAASRFAIELPPGRHVAMDLNALLMAISRDGRRLAWIGVGEPQRVIHTRTLNDLEVKPISGTEGVDNFFLFFSPDGRSVAFSRDGALWKIPVEDGVATKLFQGESSQQIFTGYWGDDETIVFGLAYSGLFRIPESGGEAEALTALDRERREIDHDRPQVLPGNRGVLFTVSIGNWNDAHIEVLDLETGNRHLVIENTVMAQYVTSGHLVFGRNETLFAVPFDLESLEVTGPETPVLSNVQMDTVLSQIAEFAVSRNGTLAYIPGGQGFGEWQLAWVTRKGGREFLLTASGAYSYPNLSPDGAQLAVVINEGQVQNVALYDLSRNVLTQFTFEGDYNSLPVWSPDGSRLAFASNRAGQWNLFVKPVGGDKAAAPLQKSANIQNPSSWSADGSLLAYVERSATDRFGVWLLPMDEESPRPIPFLVGEFNQGQARFSPTGGWIAYVSDEEGQSEVFVREVVRDAIRSGRKRKVSRDGGWEPVWSGDGRELFYRSSGGGRLLSVSIRTEPELEIEEEKVLLEGLPLSTPSWFSDEVFDVSPDGERFLAVLENEEPETMELVVVLNWDEELKRLVPSN